MVHHEFCPVCLSKNLEVNLRCTDHFISNEAFPVYKCLSCGFQLTQDYPDETQIGRYYDSAEYISHSDTSAGLSNKIYRIARGFMLGRKRRLIEKISGIRQGALLDIGSGTGHFCNEMQNSGWQVSGIEINEEARSFASNNFGLNVQAPKQINEFKPESFDIITLWHVLEHFHEPLKYISEIIRLLKPGGYCLVALPNSSSFDALYYKQFWAAYDVPRHLWHFNPDTFKLLIQKNGLEYETLKPLPLDVFYISIMSRKYKGSKFAFLTGILIAIPFAFFSLFNKEKTSSLIYILRKPKF